MSNEDLNFLIQQAKKLSPIEQQLLIQAVTIKNEDPLTGKEKEFIDISEEHLNKLKQTNNKLDEIINKLE